MAKCCCNYNNSTVFLDDTNVNSQLLTTNSICKVSVKNQATLESLSISSVPTNNNYSGGSAITGKIVYRHCGMVDSFEKLLDPMLVVSIGDVYSVADELSQNYVLLNIDNTIPTSWDPLGVNDFVVKDDTTISSLFNKNATPKQQDEKTTYAISQDWINNLIKGVE